MKADPLRVVFLNQGAIGSGVLGHGQYEASVELGLAGDDRVEPHFVRMPAWSRPERALARPVPGLGGLDLDLHAARWHLVEGARGRAVARRAIARWSPDVLHVHSHSLALGMVELMATTPTAVSVDSTVWDWHALGIWRPVRRWSRAFLRLSLTRERHVFERAAVVMAWSARAADAVREAHPGARVVVHHPGLDLETFQPAARVPRERRRVLFVGGRFREKGGEDLLEALGPHLGRTVDLDIVTTAPVAPREGVRVHRLAANAPRLVELYQQADLLCLPTRGDAYPWVVLEAMACGTPVVATPIGGIPDLLHDGDAGLLVEVGDPRALRTAVMDLLADDTARAGLAVRALAHVREAFDLRRQGPDLVRLLLAVPGVAQREGSPRRGASEAQSAQ